MKSQHSWQERHDTCLGLLVQTKAQGVACSMSQPQDMRNLSQVSEVVFLLQALWLG